MSGPMYTYTADTPQAINPMNTTTSTIQNNFAAIQELLQVNHVSWSDANASTNLGAHNFISLLNTTAPGTTSIEIDMFTQVTGSPNPCELYIQYPSGSQNSQATLQISQTTPTPPNGTSGGTASAGYCSFPSGVMIKWGNFSLSANVPGIVTFAGSAYKLYQYPMVLDPTSYGLQMPTGVCDTGAYSSQANMYVLLSGYVSSPATFVNVNYLCIGM